MKMKSYKGYIRGFRWSGIMEFLFENASANTVILEILNDDKGLIERTVYFQVNGTEKRVDAFVSLAKHAVRKYNGDQNEGDPPPSSEDLLKEKVEKIKEENPETGSEFGKGFLYCLGMFTCHFHNDMAEKLRKIKFLMDKSPEERDKIINKIDGHHDYGPDMDMAIFYFTKILDIYKTPEKMLSSEITLWANGSSDHLYEIECPKVFKGTEIEKKIEELRDKGLEMGHGFSGREYTFEDFLELQTLTGDIFKLVDEKLGIDVVKAQWGEL